ncbi:ABC transporter permease OS=Stutzerimonas stutzeri OX=316 GN=CXK95_03360 PE=4 SV=1 [Stutzerimonas stutzeri]
MNQIWNIARKELSDGLRNRWLLAISLLFAVLAVGIAWLGAAASGQLGFTSIREKPDHPASLASLGFATFLIAGCVALLLA